MVYDEWFLLVFGRGGIYRKFDFFVVIFVRILFFFVLYGVYICWLSCKSWFIVYLKDMLGKNDVVVLFKYGFS